jgi:G3E family GTPase
MLGTRAPFDEDVRYLFGKQLAEADQIIVTKRDLLDDEGIRSLLEAIQHLVGDIPVSAMSAKTGTGVRDWIEKILTGHAGERDLQLDYDTYGRAEASLGWLNASIDLVAERVLSSIDLGEALITRIQDACRLSGYQVAHVKIMFATAEGSDWIAITESSGKPAWGGERELPWSREASMIINARVCDEPEHLRQVVEACVQQVTADRNVRATVCHIESFSPLPPKRPGVMTVHPGEN